MQAQAEAGLTAPVAESDPGDEQMERRGPGDAGPSGQISVGDVSSGMSCQNLLENGQARVALQIFL